ncbi:MAG: hypothetical protein ACKV1O_03570 [Saprospiraceae bacterium]
MTKFEYACFISYRNGFRVQDHLNTFTKKFADVIANTVQGFLADSDVRDMAERNVFLDQDIFPNYDFQIDQLSQGLCKSICWVVMFTRDYQGGSLWCASELEGMTRLEKERLEKIMLDGNPDIGFVVPVLLTGDPSDMPFYLQRRKKHLIDLRHLFLRPKFETENEFNDLLTGLLDKIGRVQKVVLEKNVNLCEDCAAFRLVDVSSTEGREQIADFVKTLKTPPQPTS